MAYPLNSLALYTTIYPGVEPYLQAWYRSVLEQSDQDYQLWIGLDALEVTAAVEALGGEPQATWVMAAPGETPAQIRQRAFTQIVKACDGVVLVDSDDVLHPSRVAAARVALETSELNGCALRLVDQQGQALGLAPTRERHSVRGKSELLAWRSVKRGRCYRMFSFSAPTRAGARYLA